MPTEGLNLDEDEEVLIGRVIPAAAALLGLAFIVCTLVIAGLPPLSGFVGKFAMLSALLNPLGLTSSAGTQPGAHGWTLFVLMIATGLLALIASRGSAFAISGPPTFAWHPSCVCWRGCPSPCCWHCASR